MIHFIAAPAAWMLDADCARTDPETFFPDIGMSNKRAKAICETCPSKAPCLQWALDNNEQYGVFGGTSRADRQQIKLAELRAAEVAA